MSGKLLTAEVAKSYTMQRQLPVVHTTRYAIRFPDGYLLLYHVGRDGKTNLWFDPGDRPPDEKERVF